jgi:hypothetical protein
VHLQELKLCIREEVNSSQYKLVLDQWISLTLEWSEIKRRKMTQALLLLNKVDIFSPIVLKQSLKTVLEVASDIIIDIPKVFTYLAEVYGINSTYDGIFSVSGILIHAHYFLSSSDYL